MSEAVFEKNLHTVSGFSVVPSVWSAVSVADVCLIGRGRVISQEEIQRSPGVYPVFSSQTSNDGEMGRIDTHDFEGEWLTWTTDGANAGTVFFRNGKFNCTNVCGTLRPRTDNSVDLRFLNYHLGRIAKKYVSYVGNPKLMNDVMGRVAMILPPLPQQRKIARILTTLDNVITQTEALIAKYQAIKQGLMHDLFTRGVDATGKLRPPQSEAPELYKQSALGWIPKEWEVVSFSQIIRAMQLGTNQLGSERNDGIPLLKMGNLSHGGISLRKLEFLRAVDREDATPFLVGSGDFLFNTRNTLELVGKSAVWRGELPIAAFNSNIMRIKFTVDVNDFYVGYFFETQRGWAEFKRIATGTTSVGAIYSRDLILCRFLLAPLNEQVQIVTGLDACESQIVQERASVTKLYELKTGLMQDLLTGKVPVKADEPEEITR